MALQPFPVTHVLQLRVTPTLAPGEFGDFVEAASMPGATPTVDGRNYALPFPPTAITYSPEFAEALSVTQGSVVIESAKQVVGTIMIRGDVGQKHYLGTDREGTAKFWAGPRLFGEMRAFLKAYAEMRAESTNQKVELIWRDFHRDIHLLVIPENFPLIIDERNRIVPRWELRLKSYGEVEAVPSSFLDEYLGFLGDGAQWVADQIDTANMWGEIVNANIEDALNIAGDLLEPLRAINRTLEMLQNLGDNLRKGKQFGLSTWKACLDLADNAVYTLEVFAQAVGETFYDIPGMPEAINAAYATIEAIDFAAAANEFAGDSSESDAYEVKEGDTLPAIAAHLYGDVMFWKPLAEVNKLVPPYISAVLLPGTKQPGDTLFLPKPPKGKGKGKSVTPPQPGLSADEILYGRDIYRSPTTGEWEVSPNGDDVRIAAGLPAVEQAIDARLRTLKGSNLPFPSLGMPPSVGNPNYATSAALVLTMALEQITADDRVASVTKPQADDKGTGIHLALEIGLIGEKQLNTPVALTTLLEG